MKTIVKNQWKSPFRLLTPDLTLKNSANQFTLSSHRGFLPREDPITELPQKYKKLDNILKSMPINLPNGDKGLLANGDLGPLIDSGYLPMYDVSNVEDSHELQALFRDYAFLTSAYLLEPCDLQYRQDKTYGLGRSKIPACISVPFKQVADKLGNRPFMEYAQGYVLYNFRRIDKNRGMDIDNLDMIRKFHGGKDETGFTQVHVNLVQHTGEIVRHVNEGLENVVNRNSQDFQVNL